MSAVYLADDAVQQRAVVLKFPHEAMAGDPATYERFRREIQIGELLTHRTSRSCISLRARRAISIWC